MEPELIVALVLGLAGVTGTLLAGLVPLRVQRRHQVSAWRMERRTDAYVLVLTQAHQMVEFLDGLETNADRPMPAIHFDAIVAQLQVFASEGAMTLWREHVSSFVQALRDFNMHGPDDKFKKQYDHFKDLDRRLVALLHFEILDGPDKLHKSWSEGPKSRKKRQELMASIQELPTLPSSVGSAKTSEATSEG